jgi:hypothetical protein
LAQIEDERPLMPKRIQRATAQALPALVGMMTIIVGPVAAESIRPGYWESTNQVTAPIESTKTELRCITPKDVAKFMTCHINHHYTCNCPEQSYSGGRIHFRGDCVDAKDHHVHIEGDGTYTPTTLQMTASGKLTLMGLPMTFSASTQSHRIDDVCPAGAAVSESQAK